METSEEVPTSSTSSTDSPVSVKREHGVVSNFTLNSYKCTTSETPNKYFQTVNSSCMA